jgi:hypothetical protein
MAKVESLLKNSFVPFTYSYLGALSAVFGRFESGLSSQIGPVAPFSTGSRAERNHFDLGLACLYTKGIIALIVESLLLVQLPAF